MEELTKSETLLWEHYKAIEAENYSLKRQLVHKNKEIRALKKSYSALLSKYKKLNESRKPRYNNGKRGK